MHAESDIYYLFDLLVCTSQLYCIIIIFNSTLMVKVDIICIAQIHRCHFNFITYPSSFSLFSLSTLYCIASFIDINYLGGTLLHI